ncbi:energy-coupling factor transporter transmembrane protein EcfT [Desulfoprunum benzoelyticum]|uniref:Biotin transport system permease protein/energy-coupling factor transport system permease protein n=1 Tax=Desulfoprunum benzoelyticum TaxID=1506996 RepID=A0A840UYY8_9BACT|nr:energy-coupling factor transporter transmembrane component T [Desulfoprunum benzoelyticum]MBB5347868.1 biotin transport system permease protein/energy-coupling factor transport system permease protein [Desulfoprunum benzoelyticum]MBM9531738.1 energy-coupling factor transporter transmembrane protein EcfT [Desulfoprunum benzoelyticum]
MAALIFGYQPGHTVVHRIDARIKLAALALFSIVSLQAGFPGLGLALVAALLLLPAARCPPLLCLRSLRWYLVLLLCIVAARAATTAGEPLLASPWLPASRQGLEAGLVLAGRLLVIALLGLLVTVTTRPSHIRAAVEWYLRPLPFIPHQQIATMIGLLVRFIPVILTQSAELHDALRARAIDQRRNPLRRITYLGMPLLRRTFVTADRLAQAMEARCYGMERTRHQWRTGACDWTALGLVTGFCALLLAIS